jgi:hypothetical protein
VEPYVRSKGKVTAGHSNAVTVNGSRRYTKQVGCMAGCPERRLARQTHSTPGGSYRCHPKRHQEGAGVSGAQGRTGVSVQEDRRNGK